MADCIFCQIAGGKIPTEFLYQDDTVVAFKDINPQAPVHFLVVPKKHIGSILDVGGDDADLLPTVQKVIAQLVSKLGITDGGFRVVVNTGKDGGQTVPHLHFHVLGGRFLDWPPG